MNPSPQLGLALSGGGVRGLAHIGVLKVLEEADIPLAYLAGTSMGGIIAGLYAAGVSTERLEQIGTETGILDIASLDPHRYGLIGHKKLRDFFIDILGSDSLTFADLQLPTAFVATDVETGALVVLDEGPLLPAMLATSAFPLMFGPVHHQGRWLVDGGVLNNLPYDIVRRMGAHRVIAVDTPPSVTLALKQPSETRPRLSLHSLLPLTVQSLDWKVPFLIAETSVHFTMDLVNRQRAALCPPDLLIDVQLPNTGTFVTNQNAAIIAAGYNAAQDQLADLERLRDTSLPPRWKQQLYQLRKRLQRAWHAYQQPIHPKFP